MALQWPDMDPNEVLDFQLDWTARLSEGDTISASSWIIASGTITVDSNSFTDNTTTAWLSSGTVGSVTLTNRVTTAGGRTMDQSVNLTIVEK